MKTDTKIKVFLQLNNQNPNFNQYWYSPTTIKFLQQQAMTNKKCCFLSTPSIYYAIDIKNSPDKYYLFDIDDKFSKMNNNFIRYDFNHPEEISDKFYNYFDFILADPPFITEKVWCLYAEAINKIAIRNQKGQINAKILLSTIEENSQFLIKILNVHKCIFKPSIPNLVYQYALFSNYDDNRLDKINPEIKQN